MTVSTTNRKAGPYTGNGVTTQFPFAFRVFATTDIEAVLATAGVEATLALGVGYTATINADQDSNPGGAITLTTPPAANQVLVITSNVPATQLTLITNAGGFFPKVFNAVFDKAVILIQQLQEQLGRTLKVPITYTGLITLPVVASGVLQWAADGLSLQAVTLPDLSLSLALPAQGGHANHALFSDGVSAGWRAPLASDITGLSSALNYLTAASGQNGLRIAALNARADDLASARNFAIAAAVIF